MTNLDALKKKHAELGEEIARLEKQVNYNDHPHLFVADENCDEWWGIER